jgi:hypothetical protein
MVTREHVIAMAMALLLVIGPVGATAGIGAQPVGPPDAGGAGAADARAAGASSAGGVDAREAVTPGGAGGGGARDVNLTTCQQTDWDQKEQYGPTNVNAQLGNQELSVAVTRSGTVSVFKWPRPSYYDQIKYHTDNRSKPRMGADRNAGSFLGLLTSTSTDRIGETGTLSVSADSGSWRTVHLDQSYENPVVIASPLTNDGPDDAHARVRNVTSSTFEIQVEEWDNLDGNHVTETAHYLVVEAGEYELAGDARLEVGTVETDENWANVSFDRGFGGTPVVLSSSQTYRSGDWAGSHSDSIVTRQKNVSDEHFEVRLQETEAGGDHKQEVVGYVAVEPTSGENEGTAFTAGHSADRVDEDVTSVAFDSSLSSDPVVLAQTETFDGVNTGSLRFADTHADGFDAWFEEEQSADDETWHPTEVAGYLAFDAEGGVYAREKGVTWLRGWESTQRQPDDLSDTVVTEYRNDDLGLTVTVTDVIAADRNVLSRDVQVERDGDSPVESAELVAYENFNLVASKYPLFPTKDWCRDGENNDAARYEGDLDAVVHYKRNDTEDNDVVTAMAFEGASEQHQVAGDAAESNAVITISVPLLGTAEVRWGNDTYGDGYHDVQDGVLEGRDEFSGQTTGLLTRDLAFSNGSASAEVHFAAADSRENASENLAYARNRSFASVRDDKRAWLADQIGDAPLPNTADENVTALSRRALVTLVQNYDPKSGAISASIATQSPYGADWIRDGAYFNFVLDRVLQKHDWVRQRNLWYASLQEGANDHVHSSEIPDGNWAMNYYGDGVAAGPIPWEIDETGYGVWTLYDHYRVTGNRTYLKQVYPAIERAANHLVECRDDEGRQCAASEDDHLEDSQTIVGGSSTYVGLHSAVQAAEALGYESDADRWRTRRDELGGAIDDHYWNASTGSYGGNPRVLMPTFLKPFDDPRMQSHADAMWRQTEPTFDDEGRVGLYESKHLLGLSKAWEGNATRMQRVERGLDWVASKHATPDTHVMGEVWLKEPNEPDGEIVTSVSQPHAWEQVLFYLAALETYPPSDAVDERISMGETKWERHDPAIADFQQESGTFAPGETVNATVTVENAGTEEGTFLVGYEVVGPNGTQWTGANHTTPVTLAPGESRTVELSWTVAADAPSGSYDATAVAWLEGDPAHRTTRLDAATRTDAFGVA